MNQYISVLNRGVPSVGGSGHVCLGESVFCCSVSALHFALYQGAKEDHHIQIGNQGKWKIQSLVFRTRIPRLWDLMVYEIEWFPRTRGRSLSAVSPNASGAFLSLRVHNRSSDPKAIYWFGRWSSGLQTGLSHLPSYVVFYICAATYITLYLAPPYPSYIFTSIY